MSLQGDPSAQYAEFLIDSMKVFCHQPTVNFGLCKHFKSNTNVYVTYGEINQEILQSVCDWKICLQFFVFASRLVIPVDYICTGNWASSSHELYHLILCKQGFQ